MFPALLRKFEDNKKGNDILLPCLQYVMIYFQKIKSRKMMSAKWHSKLLLQTTIHPQKHGKLCRNCQNQVFQTSGK